jgi:hypothetical protein
VGRKVPPMLSAKTKSEVFGKRSSKRTLLGSVMACASSQDTETASQSATTLESNQSQGMSGFAIKDSNELSNKKSGDLTLF